MQSQRKRGRPKGAGGRRKGTGGLTWDDQQRVRLNAARIPCATLARLMGRAEYQVKKWAVENGIVFKDGSRTGSPRPIELKASPAEPPKELPGAKIDRMMRLVEKTRKVA